MVHQLNKESLEEIEDLFDISGLTINAEEIFYLTRCISIDIIFFYKLEKFEIRELIPCISFDSTNTVIDISSIIVNKLKKCLNNWKQEMFFNYRKEQIKLRYLNFYLCKVKYKRTDDLQEGALTNGCSYIFQAGWEIEDGQFKGDAAMIPISVCGLWVPSSEVEVLKHLKRIPGE